MASTRITIVLDIEHEPDVDLPIRAARYLERTLSDVAGLGVAPELELGLASQIGGPEFGDRRMVEAFHRVMNVK